MRQNKLFLKPAIQIKRAYYLKFMLLIALLNFINDCFTQVSQFPQIYYNGQGSGGSNLNIRASASLGSSAITSISVTSKIGAESYTTSTEANGTASWVKVCLPSTTGNTEYGYMLYGQNYARINEVNNYATTTATSLFIRPCAGCTTSNVTIGGQNAYYGQNSIVSLTGNTVNVSGVIWYEVYLTNNCSQDKGWLSGSFLMVNTNTTDYFCVAGSVENNTQQLIWGATINIGNWTTNTTEGFYQYKVSPGWNGIINCIHPNYTNSNPPSYNYTASNNYYTYDFLLYSYNTCTSNTLVFHTQEDINNFPINNPNCEVIPGSIYINITESNINLDGLSQITSIVGNLTIQDDDGSFASISGLNNINSIGGNLTIHQLSSLSNFDGLNNLISIGGDLIITDNPSIINLNGFNILTTINGNIHIEGNNNLISISNLDSLSTAGTLFIQNNNSLLNLNVLNNNITLDGGIFIINNTNLLEIPGFNGIITTSLITIQYNTSLSSISGFNSVTNINNNLEVIYNSSLSAISGFINLNSISGSIKIYDNDVLSNIDGFINLQLINTDFWIINNPLLTNLNGFQSILEIGGFVQIRNNNLLSDCAISILCSLFSETSTNNNIYDNSYGCSSVAEIQTNCGIPVTCPGNIHFNSVSEINNFPITYPGCTTIEGDAIIDNINIYNLNGLSQIISIAGNLQISFCSQLHNLYGLNSLTYVGQDLQINNNYLLQNLVGLNSLQSVDRDINITNNYALNSFQGLNHLSHIGRTFYTLGSAITNLNGLSSLSSVKKIYLGNNSILESIDDISNISNLEFLAIFDNPNLSNCAIESICNYINNPQNIASINNNAIGCSSRTEIQEDCITCDSIQIISHPQSQISNLCSQSTFSVQTTGSSPYSYQWFKNGIQLSNSNSPIYNTPQLTLADNGNTYYCIISNCNGAFSDTSNIATLTVIGPCLTENPNIALNKSMLIPNQILTIEGSNFTPYGNLVFKIEHQSGQEFGSNYPVLINSSGIFSYSLNISSSFTDGLYSISALDVSTGKSVTKTFIVNNVQNIYLKINSPIATDIIKEGMDVFIEWKDFEESTISVGQTGYIHKEYKIETSTNGGSTWKLLKQLTYSVKVNAYDRFVYFGKINYPGTYQIKITDVDNPTNFDISDAFIVTGCNGGGFKPSLEWDVTVPSEITKINPKGLAADGTARIFIKLFKSNTNTKTVKNINATISSIGNSLTGTQYLGKLLLCTDHLIYNEEANNATSTSILYPALAKGKGNENQYWFWLVAPDDFSPSLSYEGGEREIMVTFEILYSDNTSENIGLCESVKIVRPALIFAHGLFGEQTSFYNTKYKKTNGDIAYFSSSNEWKYVKYLDLYETGSFQQNASLLLASTYEDNLIIKNSFKESLMEMHKRGYANKKLDYVGHSMGGCVGRYAISGGNSLFSPGISIFKNYSKGYINKFVTINTPHNGSFLANFLIDKINTIPLLNIEDLNSKLKEFKFDAQVFFDLKAGGQGVDFPTTNIHNHLLCSDIDPLNSESNITLLSIPDKFAAFIKYAEELFQVGEKINNYYNNADYFQNSDGVVHLSSQLAGKSVTGAININNNQTTIGKTSLISGFDKFHVGIQTNIKVGNRLKVLLNAGINSDFFDESIPANPFITSATNNNPTQSRLSVAQDTTVVYDTNYIKIIYPSVNETIYVDSLLTNTIIVKDTTGLRNIILLFQDHLNITTAKDSLQIFNSIVTSNLINKQTIVAVAEYDSFGFVRYHVDTISLYILNNDTLIGFYVQPTKININPGEDFLPTFHPIFETSIGEIEINNDSLSFEIADTNVVSYNDSLFFIAKDTGSTYIVFDYLGFKDTIYTYMTKVKLIDNKITICLNDTFSIYCGNNNSLSQFQWQINTGDGFQNLISSSEFTGIDSSTLQINEINPTNNKNLFRCIISDTLTSYSSEVFEINISNTWLGVIDTAWENPLNWSCNIIPNNNMDVLIPSSTPHQPIISSYALCKTMKNLSGSILKINNGYKLCIGDLIAKCPSDTLINIDPNVVGIVYNYEIESNFNPCIDSLHLYNGLASGSFFPIGLTTNCINFYNADTVLVSNCCFSVNVVISQSTCAGGYFTNQQQIDEFIVNNPLCEHIDGSINIYGYNSNITNFNGFSNIKTISQGLSIYNCPLISNFAGFDSLISVGSLNLGSLYISNFNEFSKLNTISQSLSLYNLPQITSLSSFGSLSAINSLDITNNNGLTSLNGLENVINPLSSVYIHNNYALTSLNGLNNIPEITNSLSIVSNQNLQNFVGLNTLQKCSSVFIAQNNSLSSLSGLTNLDTIFTDLSIQGNNNLSDILDISSLDFIGNGPNNRISNNPLLSDCNIPYFCSLFLNPNLNFVIENNDQGCDNIAEIQISCGIPITCPGNISFHCQSEVDSFHSIYGTCPTISGHVTITGADITNLDSLYGIERILGDLSLSNNPVLSDLSGLNSLKLVLGSLLMYANDSIINLNDLSGIDSLGSLEIIFNPWLTSICGIDSLVVLNHIDISSNPLLDSLCFNFVLNNHLIGSLTINGNGSLKNLSGLDSLCFIDGDVSITSNNLLQNTVSLNQLKIVKGNLIISDNQNLNNIYLNSIEQIAKGSNNPDYNGFYVTNNPNLVTIHLFPNLDSIFYDLSVSGNQKLKNIYGFNTLRFIENNMMISGSDSLQIVEKFDSLQYIGNYIDISYNPLLETISCVSSLSNFQGVITLYDNPKLTQITGELESEVLSGVLLSGNYSLSNLNFLNNIKSILNDLIIYDCDSLPNLVGLDSISYVGGLNISNNDKLNSLVALSSLDSVTYNIYIINNDLIPSLNGLENVSSLGYALDISDNLILNDISALSQVDLNSIYILNIFDNLALSICDIESICNLLALPISQVIVISNNAVGCNSEMEVLNECNN